MIRQNDNKSPEPVYMRHTIYGTKVVENKDRSNFEDQGYKKLVVPTWFYHRDKPKGEIFDASETDKLIQQGWVKSPADIFYPSAELVELSEVELAIERLLSGDGLSQAALMRELGLNPSNARKRTQFKTTYDAVFAKYQSRIKKLAMKWYWTPGGPDAPDNANYPGFGPGEKNTLYKPKNDAEGAPPLETINIESMKEAMEQLLSGDGLSQVAVMRELGLPPHTTKTRIAFKAIYDPVFEEYTPRIEKIASKWHWISDKPEARVTEGDI